MAWHASAKKSLRKETKRNLENKAKISRVRTLVKKVRTALAENTDAAVTLQNAQSALAKIGAKGIVHKRTAARKVSRLMKAANKKAASSAVESAAAPSAKK
jgi:small subunit ribosomal protein S20